MELVRMPMSLPPGVHRALRQRALDEGRPASKIVLALVQAYLAKPLKKGGK